MIFTKILKSKGPSMEPCGTPDLIVLHYNKSVFDLAFMFSVC